MKLLLCGGCMTAKYCGLGCQRGDRPEHKLVCKALEEVRDNAVLSLVIAAGRGDLAKVRSLLLAGSKVDKTVSGRRTPLLAAVRRNNTAVVKLLLQSGADANKGDDNGSYPLMSAAEFDGGVAAAVVALLLQAGADANRGNGKGSTPLYAAVCYGK
jgi:hypothetical protein